MKHFFKLGIAALSIASSAQAHVVFNETEAAAGAFHTAQLRVMHGCDGEPTNRVTVIIPEGVTRVTPRAISGWTVEVSMVTLDKPILLHGFEVTDVVGSVTWSGGTFPDYAYGQFEIRMMLPDTPGERLDFPVHQGCETGELNWDDIAGHDEDPWALKEPAPFIFLEPN